MKANEILVGVELSRRPDASAVRQLRPARSRNPWPIAIVAWFVLFGGMTATMVWIASSRPEELVVQNYYADEVRFQEQIDRVRRTASAQPDIQIRFNAADRNLVVSLPASRFDRTLLGRIDLYRPSDSRLDQTFALDPDLNGLQRIDVSHLRTGLWKVRLIWSVGGEDYFYDQPIVIPKDNRV